MLIIDREFADQIPPLTEEEMQQLEANILLDGEIINPIITWEGTVVDGHNRYRILQRHPELPYRTFEKKFIDRDEIIAWICKNQLGRRNLTEEQRKYLIGKQYQAEKTSHGGDRKSLGIKSSSQSGNLISAEKTCEKIARENNVGKNYVIRADHFADGVDAAEEVEPGIRQEMLSGKIHPTEAAVNAVATAPPEERQALAKRLRDPDVQRNRKRGGRETEQDRILRKVAMDMEATVPVRKVNENSMLGTLKGIADTMIRCSNRCFELFPTLLTEQSYREQVIEIMQEPKNYIINLESGGQTA